MKDMELGGISTAKFLRISLSIHISHALELDLL